MTGVSVRVQRLRDLADAATPGPWLVGFADGSGGRCITTPASREDYSVPNVVNGGADSWGIPEGALIPADAALIAALGPDAARWIADAAEVLAQVPPCGMCGTVLCGSCRAAALLSRLPGGDAA